LVSGILYLLFKRNLWPLTLSHGLVNTIGLTLIYTGLQPVG
jgi:membrane protease YdiL (CAAX protease family)